ncbi:hypothetical protein D5R95_06835, partial [Methanosalsum natronophilum]
NQFNCYDKIVELIENAPMNTLYGFDFPLSVPEPFLKHYSNWNDFIFDFTKKYPSPDEFRRDFLELSNGVEIKRCSETIEKAPFSPYNLRLFKQTYYGITKIVYPLLSKKSAAFLPMNELNKNKPWVVEVCPACTLKKISMYFPYKGRGQEELGNRIKILNYLAENNIFVPFSLKNDILSNYEGDALDSIIGAYSLFKSLSYGKIENSSNLKNNLVYKKEGYIFS